MTNKLIEAMARALEHNSQLRGWVSYESDAAAALKAISDAGFAVVPREPTEAMIDAGYDSEDREGWSGPLSCWERMINATTTEEI